MKKQPAVHNTGFVLLVRNKHPQFASKVSSLLFDLLIVFRSIRVEMETITASAFGTLRITIFQTRSLLLH